jgi:hypothetical protein
MTSPDVINLRDERDTDVPRAWLIVVSFAACAAGDPTLLALAFNAARLLLREPLILRRHGSAVGAITPLAGRLHPRLGCFAAGEATATSHQRSPTEAIT